jgi:DNA modification methylase
MIDQFFYLLNGDCREQLKKLPDKCIQVCVTSPPYFHLRTYGSAGEIGAEKELADYINSLVEVFREVKRCLRDDGTLWLNIGDSYNGSGGQGTKPRIMSKKAAENRGGGGVSVKATKMRLRKNLTPEQKSYVLSELSKTNLI